MRNVVSLAPLEQLKERHSDLYARVQDLRSGWANGSPNSESKPLIRRIRKLVRDMEALSAELDNLEDYRWLSEAAITWQSVLSSDFETPKVIALSPPGKPWITPTPSAFAEHEIDDIVRGYAQIISHSRKAEFCDEHCDDDENWFTAEVFLMSEILAGRINFPSRIAWQSYERLEDKWLEDVKCLMAYFKWTEDKTFFTKHDEHYFQVCEELRERLICQENVQNSIKAELSEFDNPQAYIEDRYLDGRGKLLSQPAGRVAALIKRKASHIHETTGSTDDHKNFVCAETYTKMFYENIIPAVLETDKEIQREKVLRILKAFQYSRINRFQIVNCFETALAIYFLDPDIVREHWEDSQDMLEPESSVKSVVNVESWPTEWSINEPCKTRFWLDHDKRRIGFNGVMLEVEKNALLKALEKATSGRPSRHHIDAIENLYKQSRHITRRTTL